MDQTDASSLDIFSQKTIEMKGHSPTLSMLSRNKLFGNHQLLIMKKIYMDVDSFCGIDEAKGSDIVTILRVPRLLKGCHYLVLVDAMFQYFEASCPKRKRCMYFWILKYNGDMLVKQKLEKE
ncbi:putative pectate lyase 15 [Iris pallida]|uniref:Pectate lyase 15 n=1 Tax=Iris pallida TaxID=29817 RepID=A0AAX6E3I4_IRIPA|nr:putative pectate lyase 15 [Iris pallida]